LQEPSFQDQSSDHFTSISQRIQDNYSSNVTLKNFQKHGQGPMNGYMTERLNNSTLDPYRPTPTYLQQKDLLEVRIRGKNNLISKTKGSPFCTLEDQQRQ